MPRSVWSGSVSFGLVNVPVKAFTASSDKGIHFNQLHAKDNSRIRYRKVCAKEGEEIDKDEIVRGYEVAPDQYVILSEEELDSVDPKATSTIDIQAFVPLSEIDPGFFDKPYWLIPDKAAGKAYALLHKAMAEAGMVAVARVVMRGKEHLVALRTAGDAIMMVTMRYANEVVPAEVAMSQADVTPAEPSEKELTMARKLIEALTTSFDPSEYEDQYRQQVLELIEKKIEGREVVVRPEAEVPPATEDVLAALEESVRRAQREIAAESA